MKNRNKKELSVYILFITFLIQLVGGFFLRNNLVDLLNIGCTIVICYAYFMLYKESNNKLFIVGLVSEVLLIIVGIAVTKYATKFTTNVILNEFVTKLGGLISNEVVNITEEEILVVKEILSNFVVKFKYVLMISLVVEAILYIVLGVSLGKAFNQSFKECPEYGTKTAKSFSRIGIYTGVISILSLSIIAPAVRLAASIFGILEIGIKNPEKLQNIEYLIINMLGPLRSSIALISFVGIVIGVFGIIAFVYTIKRIVNLNKLDQEYKSYLLEKEKETVDVKVDDPFDLKE